MKDVESAPRDGSEFLGWEPERHLFTTSNYHIVHFQEGFNGFYNREGWKICITKWRYLDE